MIKGDVSVFAIEYEVTKTTPYLMGYFCFWIGGVRVGTLDDEIMLSCMEQSLISYIKRLPTLENSSFLGLEKEKIFKRVFTREDDNRHLLGMGESFDDFSFCSFKEENQIHFLWKLTDKPFFQYPDYPKGIMHKKVNVDYFINIVTGLDIWTVLRGN